MDKHRHHRFWHAFETVIRTLTIASIILGILVALFLFIGWPREYQKDYGITWSTPYAYSLGLDPIEGLKASMDDLGVRHFRIPAYWTDVERVQGVYDFHFVQEQLDEIAKRKGTVILAVGARLPRWPECWVPDWASYLDQDAREDVQLNYVRAVYERFKDHPSIVAWQVENEPHLDVYANCPGLNDDLIISELRMVRGEENKRGAKVRPVFTTDSGELSAWLDFANEIDGLGVSVYRVVRNPTFGVTHWITLPWFYSHKSIMTNLLQNHGLTFVSEFQMEPWLNKNITEASFEEMNETLSIEQMRDNLLFARQMDMPVVYFWGAEWWYWMKEKQGHPEFWEEAKNFFNNVQ